MFWTNLLTTTVRTGAAAAAGTAASAAALTASSADLARRAAQARPLHGAALLPYVGWCGFATALSTRIHRLNA